MSSPRVLHVIHSSAFGGGPNFLALLCLSLQGVFEMEVVCDGLGDMPARVEAVGVKVHRMSLTTKYSFGARIPALAGLIRSRRPGLVHLHGQFAGSFGQLALALAGRPRSVYTAHWPSYLDDGGRWSRWRSQAAELLSCRATAVVAISEHDRHEFLRRRLSSAERLSVIPSAYYLQDADAAALRRARRVVGFVGRLADQKGVEYLVRAAPAVLAEHPRTRFLVVGDGPERQHLESLAGELGVAAAFEFAGYDANPATRMRSMSVLAVPSIYEPLGMVALEAMACGVPVVASAVGGLPEAVEDGRTGLLVPPADPAELAAALNRLLADATLRRAMGRAGRSRARERFSPAVVAGRYADLYRRLLTSSS